MSKYGKKTAIVVGAGISGILASHHLLKMGYDVSLIEKRQEIGGRCFSIFDDKFSEYIDNGQHLLAGAYTCFIDFLKEVNCLEFINDPGIIDIDFIDTKNHISNINNTKYSGKLSLINALLKFKSISLADKIKSALLIKNSSTNSNNRTVYHLLKQYKISDKMIKYFWEPLTLAIMNTDINVASATVFNTVLNKLFNNDKSNTSLIFPVHTFNFLFQKIELNLVNRGLKLYKNAQVVDFEYQSNRIKNIILADGRRIEADNFILAIPPYEASKFNIESIDTFSKDIRYSTILSTYLWTDVEICGKLMTAMIDTKSHWLFNCTKMNPKHPKTSIYKYAITTSAADSLASKPIIEIQKIINSDINSVFKNSEKAHIIYQKTFIDKRATILLDENTNQKRLNTKTKIENLYLAGDWTNTGLPATIESAAISGKHAAEAINSF